MTYITVSDVIFAALAAFMIFWIVRFCSNLWKRVKTGLEFPPTEFGFKPNEVKAVMDKCSDLFPRGRFSLCGSTLERGMKVRLTTHNNRTFEGKIVGINNDNMICIIAESIVKIDFIDNIMKIVVIGDNSID